MSRKFQVKAIPSAWLEENGRRLDCGPYMSGAIEARQLLKKHNTESLVSLTSGHNGGIYNGPQFVRNYVDDPAHGVPFLTTSTMLQADMTNLPMISSKDAHSTKLSYLEVEEGMTLITCSGSIGRMAYARKDMAGCWSNQDIMKVVADSNKIKPGYLYAYLSSRFGVPIVISGTYGAIIQHIEPHHIAELPVPRLGDIEDKAHELNQRAADLRADANQMLLDAKNDLENEIAGGPVKWDCNRPQSTSIETKTISSGFGRLDAFHHIGYVGEAIKKAKVKLVEFQSIGKAHLPPFLKRIWVTDGGYEFLGGGDLMTLELRSGRYISPKIRTIDRFIVKEGQVLFPCVGQRYGIYGRPVLANRHLIGKAVSQAVMRLAPEEVDDAGYVSIYLSTGFGHRLSMRFSAGTSIPALSEEGAAKTLIYWPEKKRRRELSRIAEQAWENRAQATELEDEARTLVERTIEEGGR